MPAGIIAESLSQTQGVIGEITKAHDGRFLAIKFDPMAEPSFGNALFLEKGKVGLGIRPGDSVTIVTRGESVVSVTR